jgi:hypothetical protein
MQISVSLRIVGDCLNPEEISAILNVIPRVSRRKGDVRISSSKKEIVSKFGLWTWKSEDESGTLTIDQHVMKLRNTFEHAFGLLPNLPNVENAWVDICMVVNEDDKNDSIINFLMARESATALSHLGLPIEFTIYRSPTEES